MKVGAVSLYADPTSYHSIDYGLLAGGGYVVMACRAGVTHTKGMKSEILRTYVNEMEKGS